MRKLPDEAVLVSPGFLTEPLLALTRITAVSGVPGMDLGLCLAKCRLAPL